MSFSVTLGTMMVAGRTSWLQARIANIAVWPLLCAIMLAKAWPDRAVGAADQDLGHRVGELAVGGEHGGFAGVEECRSLLMEVGLSGESRKEVRSRKLRRRC